MLEIPNELPARILIQSDRLVELSPASLTCLAGFLALKKEDPNVIEFYKRLAIFDDPTIIPLISITNSKTYVTLTTSINIFFRDGFGFVFTTETLKYRRKSIKKEYILEEIAADCSFFDLIGDGKYVVYEFYGKEYLNKKKFLKKVNELIRISKNNKKDQL